MKLNAIILLSAAALSLGSIGCGSPAANTSTTTPAAATPDTVTADLVKANKIEGDVVKDEDAGLQVLVTKGMKQAKEGQDTVVKTTDGGVDIRLTTPKEGTFDAVVADAPKHIGSYLKDVKMVAKADNRTLNGMKTSELTGTGKTADGKTVQWNMTVVDAPKRPTIVNIYANKENIAKAQSDIKVFLDNIKKPQ